MVTERDAEHPAFGVKARPLSLPDSHDLSGHFITGQLEDVCV